MTEVMGECRTWAMLNLSYIKEFAKELKTRHRSFLTTEALEMAKVVKNWGCTATDAVEQS